MTREFVFKKAEKTFIKSRNALVYFVKVFHERLLLCLAYGYVKQLSATYTLIRYKKEKKPYSRSQIKNVIYINKFILAVNFTEHGR